MCVQGSVALIIGWAISYWLCRPEKLPVKYSNYLLKGRKFEQSCTMD